MRRDLIPSISDIHGYLAFARSFTTRELGKTLKIVNVTKQI